MRRTVVLFDMVSDCQTRRYEDHINRITSNAITDLIVSHLNTNDAASLFGNIAEKGKSAMEGVKRHVVEHTKKDSFNAKYSDVVSALERVISLHGVSDKDIGTLKQVLLHYKQ